MSGAVFIGRKYFIGDCSAYVFAFEFFWWVVSPWYFCFNFCYFWPCCKYWRRLFGAMSVLYRFKFWLLFPA